MSAAFSPVARRRWSAIVAAVLSLGLAAGALADTLLDDSRAVAAGVTPVEQKLTVTQAGTLDVDVTDLALPAAASSVRVAVTRAETVVKTASAAGRLSFDAVAGAEYSVRVIARPASSAAAASIGVKVTRAADPAPRTSLLEFVALFQGAPSSATNVTQEIALTIPEAGSYTATLTDFAFPAALSNVSAFLFLGSQPVAQFNPGVATTFTAPLASTAGATQYKLVLSADATNAQRAGLFGLRIFGGPSTNVVYDVATPVGALEAGQSFTNPAAGSVTLQVRDAAFPAALTQVGAVLSAGGARVGTAVTGTASSASNAPSGSLTLWTFGAAGTTPGTYQATVSVTAGAVLATRSRAVASTAANAASAFLFPFDVATAGAYRARVTDFQFPASLQSLQFAVLQNGAPVAQSTAGGTLDFNAAAGTAAVFVVAQAPTAGAGLVGVEVLTTATTPVNLLDRTQGVGALFDARAVTATTAGRYDVTLKDLGWPASFQTLGVALTRGGQVVGKVFGGGTFFFDATPGRYVATLVATPVSTEGAGLYSLKVASSVPTATLSAANATVASGQSVQLTWSSTAATACAASGAWSGTKSTSGSESVGPLSATGTYTLTCSGPGGSATAATTITVTPASSGGGGGGGGAIDLFALGLLGGLAALRRARRR
jgi:hypothetical protein